MRARAVSPFFLASFGLGPIGPLGPARLIGAPKFNSGHPPVLLVLSMSMHPDVARALARFELVYSRVIAQPGAPIAVIERARRELWLAIEMLSKRPGCCAARGSQPLRRSAGWSQQ